MLHPYIHISACIVMLHPYRHISAYIVMRHSYIRISDYSFMLQPYIHISANIVILYLRVLTYISSIVYCPNPTIFLSNQLENIGRGYSNDDEDLK